MSVKDFLPKKKEQTMLLQGRIRRSLHLKLYEKLKIEEISIKDFIEAAVRDYLEDKKSAK